jgi:hypothetical protein
MKKFEINKKVVSKMERPEMANVKGGICLHSCPRGSRRGKKCCDSPTEKINITVSATQ